MSGFAGYDRMTAAQLARAIEAEGLGEYEPLVRKAAPAELPNVAVYRLCRTLRVLDRRSYHNGWNESMELTERNEARLKRLGFHLCLWTLFAGWILGVLFGFWSR